MTNTPFYTDQGTLSDAASEAVGERVGLVVKEQMAFLSRLPALKEALLLHREKIREELPDADFRFSNGDEGLVFEVHSPSARGSHMTKESFATALESLKEQFGVEVVPGYTDEERERIRTVSPATDG